MRTSRRIGVGGLVGAGKTTVGCLLADYLGYQFLSAGSWIRADAMRNGRTIAQHMAHVEQHLDYDLAFHQDFERAVSEVDSCILEYRLCFLLRPRPFCVYLNVAEHNANQRLGIAGRLAEYPIDTVSEGNYARMRNRIIQRRFLSRFGADVLDAKNFDFVVSTDNLNPAAVVSKILKSVDASERP